MMYEDGTKYMECHTRTEQIYIAGIILGVLTLKLWGIYYMATNIGNRDLPLTNIGIAEKFSVRYGTYPGEKSLPSYANGVHRESKDD